MILERLACKGFRNLEPTEVELSPGTTLLLGDNGQGKTSFLEAIGVLATTRSFRRARAPELVAKHFKSAVTMLRGRIAGQNPHLLPRIPLYDRDTPSIARLKVLTA